MNITQTEARLTPGSWPSIIFIFLFGILGGASVTKMIPLQGDISNLFNLSAADFGFLISLVGIPSALFALPSGILVDRYGARRILLACALSGTLVNLAYAFCDTSLLFHSIRFVEGFMISATYTAGPAYLMLSISHVNRRGPAMSLWATYMPISMTLALAIGGVYASSDHWRMPFILHAAAYFVLFLITFMQSDITVTQSVKTLRQRFVDVGKAYTKPAILILGISFMAMAGLGLGANLTFPAYFAKVHDISLASSSAKIAPLTLIMVLGSFLVGIASAKGVTAKPLFTITALLGIGVGSLAFYPEISLSSRMLVTSIWFVLTGAATATLMTLIPTVAMPEDRPSAAALVNQGGAIATFIAPPVWFSITSGNNWLPFMGIIIGSWILITICVWLMLKLAPQGAS